MSWKLRVAGLVAACGLIGCAPSISVSTAPEMDGAVPVIATVSENGSSVQGAPDLAVRSIPPADEPFTVIGPMVSIGGNKYERGVLNLNPRRTHEAEVSVDYKPLFSANTQTKTVVRQFNLPMQGGCFTFDSQAAGADGWTFFGLRDGDTDNDVTNPNCTLDGLPIWLPQSIGPGASGGGSLNVPVGAGCFPTNSSQVPQKGHWRFDFVSPQLEGNSDWQNLGGVGFHVWSNIPVNVQPIVEVRKADGSLSAFAPADNNGFIFTEVSGHVAVDGMVSLPDGATVLRVRIRVFGVPEETVIGEGIVRVDSICPIPQQ